MWGYDPSHGVPQSAHHGSPSEQEKVDPRICIYPQDPDGYIEEVLAPRGTNYGLHPPWSVDGLSYFCY